MIAFSLVCYAGCTIWTAVFTIMSFNNNEKDLTTAWSVAFLGWVSAFIHVLDKIV